jgi:sugar-specific transcriptional regulator TrmB
METHVDLSLFGLDAQEQEVYLLLLRQNLVTALQLSRGTTIKRPTVYRILERLSGKGLIETQVDDKTTYYSAADPRQFETFITEAEEKARKMREALGSVVGRLSHLSKTKNRETVVKFYRGKRALQYMEFKKTEFAGTEICILAANNWYEVHGQTFAEDIRQQMLEKGITIREMQNPGMTEPISKDGSTSWTRNIPYVMKSYRHRVLPNHILDILSDVYIFNDTIHLHGYRNNDLVGIEIVNREYAAMFRQMFEALWKQGSVIDGFGDSPA